MELNEWTLRFRQIFDKAVTLYGKGDRDLMSYFTKTETAFLSSIGIQPINVYDFAEDFCGSGEPDWDTTLLMVAARRDYFLFKKPGRRDWKIGAEKDLPTRKAELGGIEWLPRIHVKAQCFLNGGLCPDIMYCCGGDRHFLKQHGIHPADFLRATWSADGEQQKILRFVQEAGKP